MMTSVFTFSHIGKITFHGVPPNSECARTQSVWHVYTYVSTHVQIHSHTIQGETVITQPNSVAILTLKINASNLSRSKPNSNI